MKKYVFIIPYFLLWILYFILTIGERANYIQAKSVGFDCVKCENGLFSSTYTFDTTNRPIRRYKTWAEFWEIRGYFNIKTS